MAFSRRWLFLADRFEKIAVAARFAFLEASNVRSPHGGSRWGCLIGADFRNAVLMKSVKMFVAWSNV